MNNEDSTNNQNSKKSPSLTRLIRTFSQVDSFRSLHPQDRVFSRYFTGVNGEVGASRIDRSFHLGNISVEAAEYLSVAFSDHFSFMVRLSLPGIPPPPPKKITPLKKLFKKIFFLNFNFAKKKKLT